MKSRTAPWLLAGSIMASIGGIAAFIILFLPEFNVYWLIISPIILALYQTPAVLLFHFYKKARDRAASTEKEGESEGEQKE